MRGLGDVIPVPARVRPVPAAAFTVGPGTAVRAAPGAAAVADHLAEALRAATGYPAPVLGEAAGSPAPVPGEAAGFSRPLPGEAARRPDPRRSEGEIRLGFEDGHGDEGYRLDVRADAVTVAAQTPAGLFAAVQTLRQFLPVAGAGDAVLPGGRIEDRPRYAYRGAMLDLARHFFTPDEVRSFIDAIAQFKINHLHLHLTDDQGWRLEIAGWPRLTEVGGGPGTGVDGAGPGFLTAAGYAELVAYAADRFVTVVPEIDMPGHVNAAQVAYPELTRDGAAVAPRHDRAVGYSSLCVDREQTYAFVEDVIREVAALTPGLYLHIGGDEADATGAEAYRTFLHRVLPLVAKYGKRAIGWHEVAAVELPDTVVPQFWRTAADDAGVARAVAGGCQVIMSPADRTYLDMKYEADSPLGLDWAGTLDVTRAYDWDPATRLPGVGERAVLGVEAPLWSETLRSLTDAQTMTFPRLAAIAEVAWSPQAARDWESFRRRLAAFGPRWTAQGVTYHRSPEIPWA
ncbi:hexosaminidase [Krasilnikovia cinnamomea]|uniref:beta-N-acetylhexosaminidase n=1 Tax=Krasilnikovia cinnamomea TaxID=349313 RepID=A0A4Q7ZPG9_9ACTN|nr:family 20 glycosylhydrolase [Krasilnikovia cinnamomea]RZU52423.1 hexosaminidase [Krasilnikovia cinnamomea]